MTLDRITTALSAWLDMVAATLLTLAAAARRRASATLAEQTDGTFTLIAPGAPPMEALRPDAASALPPSAAALLAGRAVELVLDPARVLFRPLELPRRAGDFLEGIVRAQIDRLTPWSPAEALFGWSAPADIGSERIALTVAATARDRLAPLLAAIAAARAGTVRVSVGVPGTAARIGLLQEAGTADPGIARLRQRLMAGLAGAAGLATACLLAAQFIGGSYDATLEDLDAAIAAQRRTLSAGRAADSREAAAVRALEQLKQDRAAGVLVLEALSRTLPDDTYLTELHLDGDKLEMAGISQDAPALVGLLEQSGRFADATFSAPTTRSAQEAGERFHIAARLKTPFEVQP